MMSPSLRGFSFYRTSMKRNTPEHWKMDLLSSELGICLAQAVGHMEMLFHLTAKQAMHGNIGKMPNSIIAKRCGWCGDPDKFIEALVKCKWLDECSVERLIVHDWGEHCDDATKKAVQRSEKLFCKPQKTLSDNVGQCLTESEWVPDIGCLPSLAKPIPEPGQAAPEPRGGEVEKEKKPITGNQPATVLERYPDEAKQPAIRAAIEYQTRRYGAPNPGASWYPELLHEAASVFEVQSDPQAALETFINACLARPTIDLPRTASFSAICMSCGLKKPPTSLYDKPKVDVDNLLKNGFMARDAEEKRQKAEQEARNRQFVKQNRGV